MYNLSLYADNIQLATFKRGSNDSPVLFLSIFKKSLEKTWNDYVKNNLITSGFNDKSRIIYEINIMSRYQKVSQNSLILFSLVKHYINNDNKEFTPIIYINDFKIKLNIDFSVLFKKAIYC